MLFNHVVHGFDCSILCGHRDKTDQEAAFVAKRSKVLWPNSKHNKKPSMAVDVAPYPIDWDDKERFIRFAGYVQGIADILRYEGFMTHRVKWGGDFESFFDGPHWELMGIY